MIYFEIVDKNGYVIAGNVDEFSQVSSFRENKIQSTHVNGVGVKSTFVKKENYSLWLILENEKDYLRSSRRLKLLTDTYLIVAESMWQQQKKLLDIHAHSLRTISGRMQQKLEGFSMPERYQAANYKDSVAKLINIVKSQPNKAGELIFYQSKRIVDLQMHLLSIDIIQESPFLQIDFQLVDLSKSLLNFYTPFSDRFHEVDVIVNFDSSLETRVKVDRKMFNLAIHNIIDNAAKYSMPGSKIYITLDRESKRLLFKMQSLRIDKDERSLVFDDGYRGHHTNAKFMGSGHGMYMTKRALSKMDMTISVEVNYENCTPYENDQYTENTIVISGLKQ